MHKVNPVTSNQSSVHEDLSFYVERYKTANFKRPYAQHTLDAFKQVEDWLNNWSGDVILDACCGVGESTAKLAELYPNSRIIGVDKSAHRLSKHDHYAAETATNYFVVQGDLLDFWRLLLEAQKSHPAWKISRQFLFYPNPYPKKSQLNKRWHAGVMLPYILQVSKNIEVRSNWRLYLEEFKAALALYDISMEIQEVQGEPITPFERKYLLDGQRCWRAFTLLATEN
ncbi:tRNA (guanine(46)-N(7))-methyltransferase TrmB [Glaciecola sp. 1036]|uniref:tRNA (guanine(46)-N(7))-methyltransferase TrmB n=1 Tax=Alteromonadaceae TaxID=72275 RepID=UPI003D00CEFE